MSYTKTTWSNGDTITAEKLNKIESGIENAGGGLIIGGTMSGSVMTLDKTVAEIIAAITAGQPVVVIFSAEGYTGNIWATGVACSDQDTYYAVYIGSWEFYATTENDYPSYDFNM